MDERGWMEPSERRDASVTGAELMRSQRGRWGGERAAVGSRERGRRRRKRESRAAPSIVERVDSGGSQQRVRSAASNHSATAISADVLGLAPY